MPSDSDRDPVVATREAFAAYAAKMGPAVQGQGGDAHTYRVCALGVCDFDLSEADVLAALGPWNATCLPPWDERDLVVKIRNAAKYARGERGSKIRAGRAARAGAFGTAEDTLDWLIRVIRDPIDPEQGARDLATLDIHVEPSLAREVRERRKLVEVLLAEIVGSLPWNRPKRKGKPDPGKVPPEDRPAAVLAAVEALSRLEGIEEGMDRNTWVMEQAAREHWACHDRSRAARPEIALDHEDIDRLANPRGRDGHAQKRPLPAEPGGRKQARADKAAESRAESPADREAIRMPETPEAKRERQLAIETFLATRAPVRVAPSLPSDKPRKRIRAKSVEPRAGLPEDPETIYGREEAIEKFRATLSPLERKVFETFDDPLKDVARSLNTSAKTIKTARRRIRMKVRAWVARAAAETGTEAA